MQGKSSSSVLGISTGLSIVLHACLIVLFTERSFSQKQFPSPLELTIQTAKTISLSEPLEEIQLPPLSKRTIPANTQNNAGVRPSIEERSKAPLADSLNSTISTNLDLSRSALEEYMRDAHAQDQQIEKLTFRPSFSKAVSMRRSEIIRSQRVRKNQIERLGYSEEVLNKSEQGSQAFASITRIGNRCFSAIGSSMPSLSIVQGTQVGEINCLGIRPWWERDNLSDLALQRGVRN